MNIHVQGKILDSSFIVNDKKDPLWWKDVKRFGLKRGGDHSWFAKSVMCSLRKGGSINV